MKLKTIQKLVNKATPGPWQWCTFLGETESLVTKATKFGGIEGQEVSEFVLWQKSFHIVASEADLKFISKSRTALPALLTVALAAEKACENLSPEWDDAQILTEIREALAVLTSTKFK